jgi:protein SCO1/2
MLAILIAAGLSTSLALPGHVLGSGPDGLVTAAPAQGQNPNVTVEEKIGDELPLDIPFRDEAGYTITLRDCIAGKPAILVPMYYRCPKLCNIVLQNLMDYLKGIPAYSVGKEFNVVCVSFDPKEQPALAEEKRKNTVAFYGRPGAEAGWRFLTGEKESVETLIKTIGYKFEYDRTFKEFNHPTGLVIVTPEGKIARYFYGIGFDREFTIPGGTTTLRLSLVEASEGKMGSLTDQLILTCYSFDREGYSLRISQVVKIAGLLTLFAVGTWVGLNVIRERRRLRETVPPADGPPSRENA